MFLFRLAGHLGMTVGDLVERLDAHPGELYEWMALASFEPIGQRRDDVNLTRLIHWLVSAFREKGKPLPEFMALLPDWERDDRDRSNDMLSAMAEYIRQSHGIK